VASGCYAGNYHGFVSGSFGRNTFFVCNKVGKPSQDVRDYIAESNRVDALADEKDRLTDIPYADRTPEQKLRMKAINKEFDQSWDRMQEIKDKLVAQGMGKYDIRHLKY
jgi:hypothetical protein